MAWIQQGHTMDMARIWILHTHTHKTHKKSEVHWLFLSIQVSKQYTSILRVEHPCDVVHDAQTTMWMCNRNHIMKVVANYISIHVV